MVDRTRSLTLLGKIWSSDRIMACRRPVGEWYDGPGRQTEITSKEEGRSFEFFSVSTARTQRELHTASSNQKDCIVLC